MTSRGAHTAPEVVVVDDPAGVAREGARRFATAVTNAISARGRATIALSGGSTPARLYDALAVPDDTTRLPVDWTRVHLYFGDERCVPPDHADSNYRMAREHLLERIPVPSAGVHRIEAERDPDDAAARYEARLSEGLAPGPGAFPRFDLVLLGLGPDGHTASLFPGTAALGERTRSCVANRVPALAAMRITLTFPVLNAARDVLFLVTGSEKAAALARALDPDALVSDCPARGVSPIGGRQAYLVDRAAASRLPPGP